MSNRRSAAGAPTSRASTTATLTATDPAMSAVVFSSLSPLPFSDVGKLSDSLGQTFALTVNAGRTEAFKVFVGLRK